MGRFREAERGAKLGHWGRSRWPEQRPHWAPATSTAQCPLVPPLACGGRSLAMVLQEAESPVALSQALRCPFLAPMGQDRLKGTSPAQSLEASQALPGGDADLLSSGPGGATSDSTEEDEASSTESAQNGDDDPQAGLEGSHPQRPQEECPSRAVELQHQKEVKLERVLLERALLERALAAERREVLREEQLVLQLQRRVLETERQCRAERDKEKVRLGKERRKVEELQRQHHESQTHLFNQPESMRERMQSQLQQTSEMLEGALKSYEDLEFQQLERESRLEEAREVACQALAHQILQVQESLKERKRTVRQLEGQVRSVQDDVAGEGRRLAPETGEAVQSLSSERRRVDEDRSGDHSPVSNQELTKGSIGLQRSASLPRRRGGDRPAPRSTQRPLSLNAKGGLEPDILELQLSAGGDRRCVPLTHLNAPLFLQEGPYSPGSAVSKLAEMEQKVREAMAERERLLQAREVKRAAQGETRLMESPPLAQARSPGPVREPSAPAPLDLRAHLEASGHCLETCPEVRVTGRACRGFLVKMGGRIKTWKKRWFCFDRQRRLLAYYTDKEETKLKGVIYFQAIEEVYYDHLRSAFKSPNSKLTFCVKTYDRLFCLVAPSPEAMRIWMDAIVTAAEENSRY
ncbi:pleckstrin homology-like domain family B member 3 isoform X2 [Carettochelys insculpta]|uniref:pleckstrin homology-like domain family B member 3 isoform X2 n=1 Tax=Carettochelys insculpta TaxID=44489 RepID=UPI003EBEA50F